MSLLELGPDELLSTTRAVRKRLDFTKPVPMTSCASAWRWHCKRRRVDQRGTDALRGGVIVCWSRRSPTCTRVLAHVCGPRRVSPARSNATGDELQAQQNRVADSATYLVASTWLSVRRWFWVAPPSATRRAWPGAQAAARSPRSFRRCGASCSPPGPEASARRGPPSTWRWKKAVAEIVDIPFDKMQQVCLSPLAFTKGTDFKPAIRPIPTR